MMFDSDEDFVARWRDRALDVNDGAIYIGPSFEYPRDISKIDRAMRAIANARWSANTDVTRPETCHKSVNSAVRAIQSCTNIDCQGIRDFYGGHKLSPYFEIWVEERTGFQTMVITERSWNSIGMNEWFLKIRKLVKSSDFTKALYNHERGARKNALSLTEYIDGLYGIYARLCVVRLDLSYSRAHRDSVGPLNPSRVKEDLTSFLRSAKSEFPALVGYIWKMEYGQSKSYHIHFMAFFDGHKVCKDVVVGNVLGDLWRDFVTGGDGGYWNCNAKKTYYERIYGVGVGVIAHDNIERRASLLRAAMYLAKVDYYVRLNEKGVGRIFGKGQLPERRANKVGRKRKAGPCDGF